MLTGFSEPIQWSRLLESVAFIELLKNSPMIIIDMLVGGILVGIPLSIIVYFITHAIVSKAKKRIEMKKARRMLKKQTRSIVKTSLSL
jgi:uncharacterized protein (DUF2062 family)